MTILENKISKNREHYDAREPESGHLERFADKLDAEFHGKKSKNNFQIYRIAAGIIIIISVSLLLLFQYSSKENTVAAAQLSDELTNVINHYDRLADQKLGDINSCAPNSEEAARIDQLAREQLEKLEKDAEPLKQELAKDESNKRVYGALVTNYRTRIKLLDNIIDKVCQL